MLKLISKYKPVYSYSTNPDRRFSSSTSQHFKMSPPFASSEGVSASGDRLQSDGVQGTHLLPHNIIITTDPWGGGRDL